jgi:hypothetical protein
MFLKKKMVKYTFFRRNNSFNNFRNLQTFGSDDVDFNDQILRSSETDHRRSISKTSRAGKNHYPSKCSTYCSAAATTNTATTTTTTACNSSLQFRGRGSNPDDPLLRHPKDDDVDHQPSSGFVQTSSGR